jgi:HK97 family phage portal protein
VGILQRVFNRSNTIYGYEGVQNTFFRDYPSQTSGIYVTVEGGLAMAAVWRAINLIAGTSASLPSGVFQNVGKTREMVADGPAAGLMANPHPDLTAFEFWELIYTHIGMWGNAFCLKIKGESGFTEQLWPIHPSRVQAGRAPSDLSKQYMVDGPGGVPLTDAEILHIPGFGYDGILGLSPIRMAAQGIGLALSAEQTGAKLFNSGFLSSGILTTDQRLTPEQAAANKERWQAKNGGVGNAHTVTILDSGAKFQQLSIPPEDAQFLESRKFQIDEIARWYGIPPHLLAEVDSSTSWGTGIEQQTLGFVKFTLTPTWLTRIEQRMTQMVRLVDPDYYVKYSLDGLLRGDTASRYAAYQTGLNNGWLNIDEVRALEDLHPLPGGLGENYIRPLNYTVIGAPEPAAAPAA